MQGAGHLEQFGVEDPAQGHEMRMQGLNNPNIVGQLTLYSLYDVMKTLHEKSISMIHLAEDVGAARTVGLEHSQRDTFWQ